MILTLNQLASACGARIDRAQAFLPYIQEAIDAYGIDTPERVAAFLAQIGHESGSLRYTRELASGAAYEGREDLGNTEPGDGPRYRGRGLLQVTGRDNYRRCSLALYNDTQHLLDHPEVLELPDPACRSAGWFWLAHHLNEKADAGDFERITRIINGGTDGEAARLAFYERAQKVLA